MVNFKSVVWCLEAINSIMEYEEAPVEPAIVVSIPTILFRKFSLFDFIFLAVIYRFYANENERK